MESGPPATGPWRIWTVDIRSRCGTSDIVCHSCGPLPHLPGRPLRTTALRHLARHARRDVTLTHLRICQCSRLGCPWHRRHRGCTGPVLLTLTCSAGTWRLADVCHQCRAATSQAAAIPEHTRTGPATPVDQAPSVAHVEQTEDEQALVWETSCPSCGAPGQANECASCFTP